MNEDLNELDPNVQWIVTEARRPVAVNAAARQGMIALIEKMAATPQWAEACKARDWSQIPLFGDEYKAFLDGETARIEGILKEIGLA